MEKVRYLARTAIVLVLLLFLSETSALAAEQFSRDSPRMLQIGEEYTTSITTPPIDSPKFDIAELLPVGWDMVSWEIRGNTSEVLFEQSTTTYINSIREVHRWSFSEPAPEGITITYTAVPLQEGFFNVTTLIIYSSPPGFNSFESFVEVGRVLPKITEAVCGNGVCESVYGENEVLCPQDCKFYRLENPLFWVMIVIFGIAVMSAVLAYREHIKYLTATAGPRFISELPVKPIEKKKKPAAKPKPSLSPSELFKRLHVKLASSPILRKTIVLKEPVLKEPKKILRKVIVLGRPKPKPFKKPKEPKKTKKAKEKVKKEKPLKKPRPPKKIVIPKKIKKEYEIKPVSTKKIVEKSKQLLKAHKTRVKKIKKQQVESSKLKQVHVKESKIEDFVRDVLFKDISDEEIKSAMKDAGWPDSKIEKALVFAKMLPEDVEEAREFVREAVKRGLSKIEIGAMLKKEGWKAEFIKHLLAEIKQKDL